MSKKHKGWLEFYLDGQLLGCRSIRVQVNPWVFEVWGDVYTIKMPERWIGIAHNVISITIRRTKCSNGKYSYCCY